MSLSLLLQIGFPILFLISMGKSNLVRNVKTAINGDFQNKKVTEIPMETLVVISRAECVMKCSMAPSCLSLSYNDDSKVCYLYDRDFVKVTETLTIDEVGWSYFYLVPGKLLDRSKCELPTSGICQSFCLFYRDGFSSNSVQDFTQSCTDEGGEVIKVDRYLKQYCVKKAVDNVIGSDVMTLGGVQNETTGKWSHFDGTEMTYTYWDAAKNQPEYVSPSETPGKYEGILATKKVYNYRWHDYSESSVKGVVCEIK